MDAHINKFMRNTIINLQTALDKDNPELTWAVIHNLHSVVGSYEIAAHKLKNQQTKERQK